MATAMAVAATTAAVAITTAVAAAKTDYKGGFLGSPFYYLTRKRIICFG